MPEPLRDISNQGLAHVGDAVFELMIRTWLCATGTSTAKNMHNRAVSFVSAKAQAAAANKIYAMLDDDEKLIYKRGRNIHANAVPKGSTHDEYHAATGIETLFGYLYLTGNQERLNDLFTAITEEN